MKDIHIITILETTTTAYHYLCTCCTSIGDAIEVRNAIATEAASDVNAQTTYSVIATGAMAVRERMQIMHITCTGYGK